MGFCDSRTQHSGTNSTDSHSFGAIVEVTRIPLRLQGQGVVIATSHKVHFYIPACPLSLHLTLSCCNLLARLVTPVANTLPWIATKTRIWVGGSAKGDLARVVFLPCIHRYTFFSRKGNTRDCASEGSFFPWLQPSRTIAQKVSSPLAPGSTFNVGFGNIWQHFQSCASAPPRPQKPLGHRRNEPWKWM